MKTLFGLLVVAALGTSCDVPCADDASCPEDRPFCVAVQNGVGRCSDIDDRSGAEGEGEGEGEEGEGEEGKGEEGEGFVELPMAASDRLVGDVAVVIDGLDVIVASARSPVDNPGGTNPLELVTIDAETLTTLPAAAQFADVAVATDSDGIHLFGLSTDPTDGLVLMDHNVSRATAERVDVAIANGGVAQLAAVSASDGRRAVAIGTPGIARLYTHSTTWGPKDDEQTSQSGAIALARSSTSTVACTGGGPQNAQLVRLLGEAWDDPVLVGLEAPSHMRCAVGVDGTVVMVYRTPRALIEARINTDDEVTLTDLAVGSDVEEAGVRRGAVAIDDDGGVHVVMTEMFSRTTGVVRYRDPDGLDEVVSLTGISPGTSPAPFIGIDALERVVIVFVDSETLRVFRR